MPGKLNKELLGISDIVKKGFRVIEDLYEGRSCKEFILSSGFEELDLITTGFYCGDLVSFIGRPGSGKSTILRNIALNLAVSERSPVAVIDMSSNIEQLCMNFICAESKVDNGDLAKGHVTRGDWLRMTGAARNLLGAPLYFIDAPCQTASHTISEIKKAKAKHPEVRLIIVDPIYMIIGEDIKRLESCLRRLKRIALRQDVCIICADSFTTQCDSDRDGEGINDYKYTIFEKYSDLLISMLRQKDDYILEITKNNSECEYADNEAHRPSAEAFLVKYRTEFKVLKNKNGPSGSSIFLNFQPGRRKFVSVE